MPGSPSPPGFDAAMQRLLAAVRDAGVVDGVPQVQDGSMIWMMRSSQRRIELRCRLAGASPEELETNASTLLAALRTVAEVHFQHGYRAGDYVSAVLVYEG